MRELRSVGRLRPRDRALIGLPVLFATLLVGATCSSGSEPVRVRVTATEDDCVLGNDAVPSGSVIVELVNESADIADLFLLTPTDGVIAKQEDIAAGAKGEVSARLIAGQYFVTCIPGGAGTGNRAVLTVR